MNEGPAKAELCDGLSRRSQTRRRWSRRALAAAIAYGLMLFWINHIPKIGVSLGGGSDKVAHFAAYGILAFLIAWTAFPERQGSWKGYGAILMLAAGYGAADETLQRWVPNRSADVNDWIADVAGAAIALAVHRFTAPTLGRIRRLFGRFPADPPAAENGDPSAKTQSVDR